MTGAAPAATLEAVAGAAAGSPLEPGFALPALRAARSFFGKISMPPAAIARLAFVVLFLAILFAGYSGLHDDSQRLLTPIPGRAVGVPMALSMALAFGLGQYAVRAINSRLVRRLVLLATMASTLYLSGECFRGLYARSAFSGPLTSSAERWMTMGNAQGTTITAQSPGRRKNYGFPATPEAVAAAGFGKCITVRIERSADGLERIAPEMKALTPADLARC